MRHYRMHLLALAMGSLCGICLGALREVRGGQGPVTDEEAAPPPRSLVPQAYLGPPHSPLNGPILSEDKTPPTLPTAQPEANDVALPINLATALRLADARPLVVAAAQVAVQAEAARLSEAKFLWLPNFYVGAAYARFDGATQGQSGALLVNTREEFMAGAGATMVFAATDAIFLPLAQRQVVRASASDLQRARNDALAAVAEYYFNVQQARGRLAGAKDTLDKAVELEKRVASLGKGYVAVVEVDRVRAALADLQQSLAMDREDWRTNSADLTRALRLDPTALITPLEPPYLQVTLVSPAERVDDLVPIGLTNRPELATQQALVQAALLRLRQERLRPLIPSLVIAGDASPVAPGGFLADGVFASGANGMANPTGFRNNWSAQVIWEFKNLGLGNRALVREREAQRQQQVIELFKVQDMVAAEVVRAHAQVLSAQVRMHEAEIGVKEALVTYAGNVRGLSETTRVGDVLVLVVRPQEAVAALQQLAKSYDNYFLSIADFNRAEFRLYRALGYPAGILACERSTGPIMPVNLGRPASLPPVCAPEPCANGCPR